MTRLTKKFNGEYYYKNATTIMFNSEINYNTIQKLGELEDLEEQLNCPLEIIFKATENGIIDYKGKVHEVLYGGKYLFAVKDDELYCAFYLNNYQKTWWLKEKN